LHYFVHCNKIVFVDLVLAFIVVGIGIGIGGGGGGGGGDDVCSLFSKTSTVLFFKKFGFILLDGLNNILCGSFSFSSSIVIVLLTLRSFVRNLKLETPFIDYFWHKINCCVRK